MGAHISNGGPGTTGPPAGDGPGPWQCEKVIKPTNSSELSRFIFQFGGLGALFRGAKLLKVPCGNGTGHKVVIFVWYALFGTSCYDVLFTFLKQPFGGVWWHNVYIVLHALSHLGNVHFTPVGHVFTVKYQHSRLRIVELHSALYDSQGHNEGGEGSAISRARSHYGGAKSLRRALKSPNNVTSTFFNKVHLLPKDPNFELVGVKLVSCPGRHLTSLRP